MGGFGTLIDATLFIFFLVIGIAAPLLDAQTCLPAHFFPRFLVDIKSWYVQEYGDYLVSQKPHFFVGLVWLELAFQWPLAVTCLYGIAAGKSWLPTTCLMYGASALTSMAAILGELTGVGSKTNIASDKLLRMYLPFMGLSIVALLRGLGLLCCSVKGKGMTLRPPNADKKRA